MPDNHYIGRFAPSPSGDLHFGSLIAALGSYLQARSQQGQWLVRIEDIDPLREMPGAAQRILSTLERYGLYWDREVLYQSQRTEAYQDTLAWLQQQGSCYYCTCTRSRIQGLGGIYDGHCRLLHLPPTQAALRLYQSHPVSSFSDRLLGHISAAPTLAGEDFIIRRRDGLHAYNLAVVVDDLYQGVTEIVRGADLVEPTVHQIALYHHLAASEPSYLHLPLAMNSDGRKLSKQNRAPALPQGDPRPSLVQALSFLGQRLPDDAQSASLSELLDWGITHWSVTSVPHFSTYEHRNMLKKYSE